MSPIPAAGHRSYIAFGKKESAYGVWTAPTTGANNGKRYDLIDWSVEPLNGLIPDNTLSGALSRKNWNQGLTYFKGTFTVRLNYEGLLEFFRASMGGYGASAVIEAATYDHTFREATSATPTLASTLLNSYSGEVSWADMPTGTVWRMTGCKLLGWTLSAKAGAGAEGMCTIKFSLWGRLLDTNSGTGYSPSAPTAAAYLPVLFHHPWLVFDGTNEPYANIRARSIEIAYEPPHEETRSYLGSIYPDEPIRSDYITPTWKIEQEFNSMSLYNYYLGLTDGAPRVIFQHPTALATHSSVSCTPQAGNTITRAAGSFVSDGWVAGDYIAPSTVDASIPVGLYVTNVVALTLTHSGTTTSGASQTITGGVKREIELRSASAKMKNLSAPINAPGAIVATATWEGFYNATDFASLLVRVRNTETALP